MSGSNYGGANATATITLVVNIDHEINCQSCLQLIIDRINATEGVESVTKGVKLLTVVQKLHPQKIRTNTNFYKPHMMTAVMGVNIECNACLENTKNIVSSTPGFQDMALDMENRLVTVKGNIAINTLARRLRKTLRKFVKIISINIECGGDGCGGSGGGRRGGGCSNPNCLSPLQVDEVVKSVLEIVK